ncbi:MAG: hypothetical protein FWG49_04575, partial [Leptospirales bacterium]|nr:hypothetical protein [Leptospirales bacterium]
IPYFYIAAILLLLLYRKLRISRWRNILRNSIEYHKFHLSSLMKDSAVSEKSRELSQALFWAITKQLPAELESGRGGAALWKSLFGDKTALNTCGTVFYQCARNFRNTDGIIIKLNDTLMSTIYRIYLLESYASIPAILYMDFMLLINRIIKPEGGPGRLYLELRKE